MPTPCTSRAAPWLRPSAAPPRMAFWPPYSCTWVRGRKRRPSCPQAWTADRGPRTPTTHWPSYYCSSAVTSARMHSTGARLPWGAVRRAIGTTSPRVNAASAGSNSQRRPAIGPLLLIRNTTRVICCAPSCGCSPTPITMSRRWSACWRTQSPRIALRCFSGMHSVRNSTTSAGIRRHSAGFHRRPPSADAALSTMLRATSESWLASPSAFR